jgi:hypothetical protein
MEVYLSALTFGKIVLAASEFGMTVDELMEEAAHTILRAKAAELFEREYAEAKWEADQGSGPSLQRYEFERQFRRPSWAKDATNQPPPQPPR